MNRRSPNPNITRPYLPSTRPDLNYCIRASIGARGGRNHLHKLLHFLPIIHTLYCSNTSAPGALNWLSALPHDHLLTHWFALLNPSLLLLKCPYSLRSIFLGVSHSVRWMNRLNACPFPALVNLTQEGTRPGVTTRRRRFPNVMHQRSNQQLLGGKNPFFIFFLLFNQRKEGNGTQARK